MKVEDLRNLIDLDITCPKCGSKLAEIRNSELYIRGVTVKNTKIVCPKCGELTYDIRDLSGGTIVLINVKDAIVEGIRLSNKTIQKIKEVVKGDSD